MVMYSQDTQHKIIWINNIACSNWKRLIWRMTLFPSIHNNMHETLGKPCFLKFLCLTQCRISRFLFTSVKSETVHMTANRVIGFNMSRLVTKPTKRHVHPAKTQISLGIRPVWSESSLSAWTNLESLATHWVHSEESDQTGRMPRLIWIFAGRTVTLLVLYVAAHIFQTFYLEEISWQKATLCSQPKVRGQYKSEEKG